MTEHNRSPSPYAYTAALLILAGGAAIAGIVAVFLIRALF